MNKVRIILVAAAFAFAGCQKDNGAQVNIGVSDLSAIKAELSGTWVFPSDVQTIVDSGGVVLSSARHVSAPAMQFYGSNQVKVFKNLDTVYDGSYSLSTSKGLIFLSVSYGNIPSVQYQILKLDAQTLQLVSKTPYTFSDANGFQPANALSYTSFKKQGAGEATAGLIRVVVYSSQKYSLLISLSPPAVDSTLRSAQIASLPDTGGIYSISFPSKPGDQLGVNIGGDWTQTSFFAFYNGIPMGGGIGYQFAGFKTTSGWTVH